MKPGGLDLSQWSESNEASFEAIRITAGSLLWFAAGITGY